MQENTNVKESTSSIDVIRQGRIDKAQNLREQGFNPYPYKFEKTAFCHRHFSVLLLQIKSNFSFPIEIGREEEKANGCY